MLTQSDIEFIKANRAEITQNRTDSITLVRMVAGEPDPYTGEPTVGESTELIDVIWKEYSTVANGERSVINGVELIAGDVQVTFELTVDLLNVIRIEKNDVNYSIVTVDEKGLGEVNRRECVVRRLT
ncbi:hypothetical protein [Bacillus sp. 03113]|uniref:hypothetical protein n=1 Tax=Bacillus sp. 03113 TaxID=2578211 RepID=UPI0011439678|nr:hypothetical protein [Bacillus sp. 03113]